MKSLVCALLLAAISLHAYAQPPSRFNYQAVLRDDAGQPMALETVEVELAIIAGDPDGHEVFSETHQAETNAFGMVNLKVGSISSLEEIDWGAGTYYVRVAVNGETMGITQLLSVPFALHAETSADAFSGLYDDLEGLPELDHFISVPSPLPGDIIYYDGEEWKKLEAGADGTILRVVGGVPQWTLPELPTDIDGNVYSALHIGDQVWMGENLRVTRYRDGTPIPTGFGGFAWHDLEFTETGAYAIYPPEFAYGIDTEEEMATLYGKLYNWYAVDDERGLCPEGWRLATHRDWQILEEFVQEDLQQDHAGDALKSCRQVNSPLGGDCATDEHPRWNENDFHFGIDHYGFSALPSGGRFVDGEYEMLGGAALWWTPDALEDDIWGTTAYSRSLFVYSDDMEADALYKTFGLSVRCIQGGPVHSVTFDIRDELNYPVTDAVITLDGQENEPGDYLFVNLESGQYAYAVQADDYQMAEGTVEVSDQDIVEYVVLDYIPGIDMFTVGFAVSDQFGEAVEQAIITFGGAENEPGDYSFTAPAGTYQYGVKKQGYLPAEGQTEVVDDDVLVEVVIEMLTTDTVTDIDGNEYHAVLIGDQWWTASNLIVTRYRDGSFIQTGLTNEEWSTTNEGAFDVYPHENVEGIDSYEEMVQAYGHMYNFIATQDERGLCPEGWRVPTADEWLQLIDYVEQDSDVSVAGKILKSCRQINSPLGGDCATAEHPRWNEHHEAYGTDEYNFSALPGGNKAMPGSVVGLGMQTGFWSSTPSNGRGVRFTFNWTNNVIFEGTGTNRMGYPIRCIRTE